MGKQYYSQSLSVVDEPESDAIHIQVSSTHFLYAGSRFYVAMICVVKAFLAAIKVQ